MVKRPPAWLLSPGGFLLAALTVLLPFGTVSCGGSGVGGTVSYTGAQLIGNTGGSLSLTDPARTMVDTQSAAAFQGGGAGAFLSTAHTGTLRLLLIIEFATLIAGVVVALIHSRLVRVTIAGGLALAAV